MYNLLVKENAQKSLIRLPSKEADRLSEAIAGLQTTPRPTQSMKLQGYPNAYRIRKGNYRILYTIDDPSKTVVVYKIAHRREVYRF